MSSIIVLSLAEGERALKQTLRDREVRLSSMADKLEEYESWFRETNSYPEEMLRSSIDLDALERRRPLSYDGASSTLDAMHAILGEHMPGGLPEKSVLRPAHAGPISVTALFWTTLFAFYYLA